MLKFLVDFATNQVYAWCTMSDDQFTQLNQKVDDLSQTLNAKIDNLGKTLDEKIEKLGEQLGEQILRLYQHTEQRFDYVDKTKADKATVDQILHTVDGIVARLDEDAQERAAMGYQLNRHQGWIKQLATNTNTKLIPKL